MITTFSLVPYVGAIPIRFGMTSSDVSKILGPPLRVSLNFLGEREEDWDELAIRYSAPIKRSAT